MRWFAEWRGSPVWLQLTGPCGSRRAAPAAWLHPASVSVLLAISVRCRGASPVARLQRLHRPTPPSLAAAPGPVRTCTPAAGSCSGGACGAGCRRQHKPCVRRPAALPGRHLSQRNRAAGADRWARGGLPTPPAWPQLPAAAPGCHSRHSSCCVGWLPPAPGFQNWSIA